MYSCKAVTGAAPVKQDGIDSYVVLTVFSGFGKTTSDSKQGVATYTNVNTTTGGFCVIVMYASTASTGDAERDFKKE